MAGPDLFLSPAVLKLLKDLDALTSRLEVAVSPLDDPDPDDPDDSAVEGPSRD